MNKRITAKQKESLVNGYEVDGFELIDEQFLFMDNHGCNVHLVVVQVDGDLLGFTYRMSSEEHFYEDDPMELVPVIGRPVTITEYSRADGDPWGDWA